MSNTCCHQNTPRSIRDTLGITLYPETTPKPALWRLRSAAGSAPTARVCAIATPLLARLAGIRGFELGFTN